MEKLAIKAENLFFLSHRNPSSVFDSSAGTRRLRLFPPKDRRSRVRVLCSVKETQKLKESQRVDGVVNGIPVSGSEVEFGAENRSEEAEFTWNWPPWKNLPERYKLIGTTSLAFIICNMDKVVTLRILITFCAVWHLIL